MKEPIQATKANRGCQDSRDANLRWTNCARGHCECQVCGNAVAGNRTVDISTDAAETGAKVVDFAQFPGGLPNTESYIQLIDALVNRLAAALK